ncbi:hypothetical protein [Pseudoduganella lutea]|uniref:HEAT repeat domain-containing protein n=1 Tax=Pseudoduganella lutea TaxID=321985 RepID=A0A4P6L7K0_9BURK|nr:hypothetical protein [Pseudoduganella lutea]QBE66912.1 hypothetical protein EWM63_31325 [Pseudoduganella lutea]
MEPEVKRDLKELLDVPESALWYEYAAGAARDIIEEEPEEILRWLLDECADFNANMQEHLAYILCDEPGSFEHEILVRLSKSGNEGVAWRANEALNYYR